MPSAVYSRPRARELALAHVAARPSAPRYLRAMWTVGCSEPHNQLNAAFETSVGLADALARLEELKRERPTAHVWASCDYYDVAARQTETGAIGFVVEPTTETDSEPPRTCQPYDAAELLELDAAEAVVLAAEEDCPTCGQLQRGRHANRSVGGYPLFICSNCEHWTETVPRIRRPGPRSRRSLLAE